ncbi:MAG: VOC family protein [Chloroflexota bacterium]|nr:VOC family protein [Chloroflexota bacterium]
MKAKPREQDILPWDLAHQLVGLSLNLIVRDVARSAEFWTDVLGFILVRIDDDLAAIERDGARILLHADHTHREAPWGPALATGARRGLGAEIRLLGIDPDEAERRARERGDVVLRPTADRAHKWRECILEDPDGYGVVAGIPI